MFKRIVDFTEMDKLAKGLDEREIFYVRHKIFDGEQIRCDFWDAVCHSGSYGHEMGLLEIMDVTRRLLHYDNYDEVEGWLTAKEILKRIDNLKENT